jgi:hypothetical protein
MPVPSGFLLKITMIYNGYGTMQPAQHYGYLNDPHASVSYMNPPAQPLPATPVNTVELLVNYVIGANKSELQALLVKKGIAPSAPLDDASLRSLTMKWIAQGTIAENEKSLKELLALHPDKTLILDLFASHAQGCSCESCKSDSKFFTKDRLLFIGLIIVLFVGMYFITQD